MARNSAGSWIRMASLVAVLLAPIAAAQEGTTTLPPWQFRLAGGTAMFGRLEARDPSQGRWGTVCAYRFGVEEAAVACRSVGVRTADTVGYRRVLGIPEYGSGHPMMDEVGCQGTEARLDLCYYKNWETAGCSQNRVVVVSCENTTVPPLVSTNVGFIPTPPPLTAAVTAAPTTWSYRLTDSPSTATYGRLEVFDPSIGSWGTVCDDWFGDEDAIVACRSLGMPTDAVGYRMPDIRNYEHRGTDALTVAMDDVDCTGTEAQLHLCPYLPGDRSDCHPAEGVLLSCGTVEVPGLFGQTLPPPSNETSNTTAPAPLNGTWEYRLTDGTSANGRLEVYSPLLSRWGAICNRKFSVEDATVACRSLGLATDTVAYRTVEVAERTEIGRPAMAELQCRGTEESLDQCPFVGPDVLTGCTNYLDIVLSCGSSVVAAISTPAPTPAPPTTAPPPAPPTSGAALTSVLACTVLGVATVVLACF